jgi:hypothetical protein
MDHDWSAAASFTTCLLLLFHNVNNNIDVDMYNRRKYMLNPCLIVVTPHHEVSIITIETCWLTPRRFSHLRSVEDGQALFREQDRMIA